MVQHQRQSNKQNHCLQILSSKNKRNEEENKQAKTKRESKEKIRQKIWGILNSWNVKIWKNLMPLKASKTF